MRILRVTSDLYPRVMGGVGVHTHEMSRLQNLMGHQVTVITSKDENKEDIITPYPIEDFTPLVEVFGNKISLDLFFILLSHRKGIDVIHAHSHLFFSTNVSALLRRLGCKPLIITSHGLYSQSASKALQDIYMATLGLWTLKSADRVICYTYVEKKQIERLGVPVEKINVVNNGVDTEKFKPLKTQKKTNVILWVGRYVPGKGVDILIEGFENFSKTHPDYILRMVGNGPFKMEAEKSVRAKSLESKVEFIDSVSNEDMPEIYSESDIFVLTSYEEGVPRSILEAMACGKPIVCSALPQLTEIVSESGLTFPVGDQYALSEAFRLLADDDTKRNRLGEMARARVLADYSWEKTVKRTLEIYQEVINEML